jgi:predicted outer membrane protein
MKRSWLALCGALAAAAAASLLLVLAPTASAAPSASDASFLSASADMAMGEVSLGQVAIAHATDPQTAAFAQGAVSLYQSQLANLQSIAKGLGAQLPSAPSDARQQEASTLRGASAAAFDSTYMQLQIADSPWSIASANSEASGAAGDAAVVAYARSFLSTAGQQLAAAQSWLQSLGGMPTGVPAGTGGLVSTNRDDRPALLGLLSGGVATVAGGLIVLGSIRGRRHGLDAA